MLRTICIISVLSVLYIVFTTIMPILQYSNEILSIAGHYECYLESQDSTFIQDGFVKAEVIKQAPVLRIQSKLNVKCMEGQTQPIQCCVQSGYKVKWFQGTTELSTGKFEF